MSDKDESIEIMEAGFREIIQALGEDIGREGLVDTPRRAAKALSFITQGYHQNLEYRWLRVSARRFLSLPMPLVR